MKSRVPENQYCTFYCPRLVAKGVQRVGGCVSDTVQLRVDVIQQIPQWYKSQYVRHLVYYIDVAHGREPKPAWSALPGCAEWELSTVLAVCRTELKVEVRQQPTVWANVQAQQVPFRLKEFVVAPLWRKLPVAQRLNNFQVLGSVDCPPCGVLEDHPHVFKNCFFLHDSLAQVRRFWRVHVSKNDWHEPSKMCTDHPEWSVSTIQGWLVWSAIYARWLIKCEALSKRPPDVPTAVLQRFFSVMLTWKAVLQGALPREVVQRTCNYIKDIIRVRDKLQGLSRQQGTAYLLILLTPSKVTGKKRRTHTGLRLTDQAAHTDQRLGGGGDGGKCDGVWGHIRGQQSA